jgi:hypothetical protein
MAANLETAALSSTAIRFRVLWCGTSLVLEQFGGRPGGICRTDVLG